MKSRFLVLIIILISIFFISGCVESQNSSYSESNSVTKLSAKNCVQISDLNTQFDVKGYRVMGRLTNICDEDLDFVAFRITAYDENGKIIDVLTDRYPCSDGEYGLDARNSCTFRSAEVDGLYTYDIEISRARYRV